MRQSSTIANEHGVMMELKVSCGTGGKYNGGAIKETKAKEIASPLSAEECKTQKMLRKVVTTNGHISLLSRYKVYGKTGSAEYNDDKDSHAGLSVVRELTAERLS